MNAIIDKYIFMDLYVPIYYIVIYSIGFYALFVTIYETIHYYL